MALTDARRAVQSGRLSSLTPQVASLAPRRWPLSFATTIADDNCHFEGARHSVTDPIPSNVGADCGYSCAGVASYERQPGFPAGPASLRIGPAAVLERPPDRGRPGAAL